MPRKIKWLSTGPSKNLRTRPKSESGFDFAINPKILDGSLPYFGRTNALLLGGKSRQIARRLLAQPGNDDFAETIVFNRPQFGFGFYRLENQRYLVAIVKVAENGLYFAS